MRPIKDLLHGRWLGHSVHAALTDLPIGIMALSLLFDVIDLRSAADVALSVGILAMLAAAISGAADYSDTDDDARTAATVHATLMVVALLVYVLSLWLRVGAPVGDRLVPIALSVVGVSIISIAAWVGGEVVYTFGNMVNRHAWRFGPKADWLKLDVAEIPESQPMAAKAGTQSVVVVRQGDRVYALHAQCAHANGPLPSGRIVDGCIECPLHFSRFDLATGRRRQGPTTFDQPRYEVRDAEGGGYEIRRVVGTTGQNY
jgi:nitrite reductase/ring-hydroxylating ferredoxin subunit/uncharacterized membrane protein